MRLNTVNILGIHITSTSAGAALKVLASFVAKPASLPPLVVFTPNPEFLVEASEDLKFRELLNRADINLPDGVGLIWASRVLGTPIKERVSGADVVERLLEKANSLQLTADGLQQTADNDEQSAINDKPKKKSWIVGISGARRGDQEEANELIKRLGEKYPNVKFVNLDKKSEILNPKSETNSNVQNSNDRESFEFRASNFEIVFAAHGMKKQEQWILENKDRIRANVFMGVGGALDFIVGFTKRAPLWMRQVGLEWLWRGLQRPGHWKRVWKAVFVFGWMVVWERLRGDK